MTKNTSSRTSINLPVMFGSSGTLDWSWYCSNCCYC